jgi:hypothetical protein
VERTVFGTGFCRKLGTGFANGAMFLVGLLLLIFLALYLLEWLFNFRYEASIR